MNKSMLFKNIAIYFLLIMGYILLYEVPYEIILDPNLEMEVSSAVNFVYQQF